MRQGSEEGQAEVEMKVAISGVRDISPHDLPVIEGIVSDILFEKPEEIFFGGARGVDTVALAAACAILQGSRPPKLTVIVPKRLKDQPFEAQEWIKECADEVIELKAARLDIEAYRRRNMELIRRADGLVAFWDGRSGGTGMTIELAHEAGIPVEVIEILGESHDLGGTDPETNRPASVHTKPWPHWTYSPTSAIKTQVITLGFYMAAIEGLDRLSQFVRAMKAGTVGAIETKYWANVISGIISDRPELADAVAIVPVPRRMPGRRNDMSDLVARISSETGKIDATDLLVRVEEPTGGEFKGGRQRFNSEEHARTIAADLEHKFYPSIQSGSKVILLDNVITYGGSLEGARQAITRDLPGIKPIGLSILVSGAYSIT